MSKYFLRALLACFSLVTGSMAQTSDSLSTIEQQQEALRREQMRLKAQQDSLDRVQEKLRRQEALKQQEEQKQNTTSKNSEAPKQRYNKTVIAIHPLLATIGQVEFSVEQAIAKTSSIYLEFGFHDLNLRENGTAAIFMPGSWIAYSGYKGEIQYRSYLLPEQPALYKLYVAPHFLYKQNEITRGEGNRDYSSHKEYEFYKKYKAEAIGFGLNVGYQMQFLKHLTFDTSLGTTYNVPLSDKVETDILHLSIANPYKRGLFFRMDLSLGFAF